MVGLNRANLPSLLLAPSPRSPRSSLLRPRLVKKPSHGHVERAGYFDRRPDGQVLPAALDALEVLEREAKPFRLLLLGEAGPTFRSSR